jgi:ABC-2 type transport system permease protein
VTTTAPTAPLAPARATTAPARLRLALADGWIVARRDLLHWLRNPTQVLWGLLFPIVSVVMFGYVFGSSMTVAGGGDYREFLMPGLFVMTIAFGFAETAIAITTDAGRGVTDRFRSMPMAPSAVVLGRSMADLANGVLNLALLVLCGLAVGWSWHEGPGGALAAVGLLLLLRFGLIWVGIWLGLVAKSPEAVGAMYGLLFPVTMIANTFASPELMPAWLGAIAAWNPLSATASATRELFGNPGLGGGSWIAEHALPMAVVWPLVLVAVFLPLSVRRYRRLSR